MIPREVEQKLALMIAPTLLAQEILVEEVSAVLELHQWTFPEQVYQLEIMPSTKNLSKAAWIRIIRKVKDTA